ncbi:helix-turn-helix transcriptional regulator [Paenibacillus alba]|uniref:helix-turn-helix domain-containing protein n=1 Tax=Paenibacillus alba TaxID=1197127 RepID=UPI001564D50D|nr:helix-turn-helix domain-containing protein [Paenibacillus alba]NQX66656.1 helix-turn-helix transcriptional regulator [Paenibacillus alba]
MIGLEYVCQVFNKGNKEIGEKLNINPTNISSWFKGTREIPTKYLSELSKIFNGLSPEYFQKELTRVDEIKIRIHYIEKGLNWEERHSEESFKVQDEDGNILLDEKHPDEYSSQLLLLHSELNKLIKTNSYQDRIQTLFAKIDALTVAQKVQMFKYKNPEDFTMEMLNSYLDFLTTFRVKDISAIDLIIDYFMDYKGINQSKWTEQDVFPNEKQLAFYSDLEELLNKHNLL